MVVLGTNKRSRGLCGCYAELHPQLYTDFLAIFCYNERDGFIRKPIHHLCRMANLYPEALCDIMSIYLFIWSASQPRQFNSVHPSLIQEWRCEETRSFPGAHFMLLLTSNANILLTKSTRVAQFHTNGMSTPCLR